MSNALSPLHRAYGYGEKIALRSEGTNVSYRQLLDQAGRIASGLLKKYPDLRGKRVAFLLPQNHIHVAVQWAIWQAGGIAVPLCATHSVSDLKRVIQDSKPSVLIGGADFHSSHGLYGEGIPHVLVSELLDSQPMSFYDLDLSQPAMIFYTSGTAGSPKGVLVSHNSLIARMQYSVDAWEWSASDRVISYLSLHHIHANTNVVGCALWAGATCTMLPSANPKIIWDSLLEGSATLFMGIPTIYSRLITEWQKANDEGKRAMRIAGHKLRVSISGSSSLTERARKGWKLISGQYPLERYGMTEAGTICAQPLRGVRTQGTVGAPLPGVEVLLAGVDGRQVSRGEMGRVLVRSHGLFSQYWGHILKPIFTPEGWFDTGDMARVVDESGNMEILGRRSLDVVKTGGELVSCLEIERILMNHPNVEECAVVGVADDEKGQIVFAAITLRPGSSTSPEKIKDWMRGKTSPHKVPREIVIKAELPRNVMGKVDRLALAA